MILSRISSRHFQIFHNRYPSQQKGSAINLQFIPIPSLLKNKINTFTFYFSLITDNKTQPIGKRRINSINLSFLVHSFVYELFRRNILKLANIHFYFIFSESQNPIPPPTYTNDKLLKIINQKKKDLWVFLNGLHLTNEDMEIVDYYLLRNNTVIFHC